MFAKPFTKMFSESKKRKKVCREKGVLVPTLCVGTHVLDALVPSTGYRAMHRVTPHPGRRASRRASPTQSVGTSTSLIPASRRVPAQAAQDAGLGNVYRRRGDPQLPCHFTGRPAQGNALPACLPGGGLEIRLHQLRAPGLPGTGGTPRPRSRPHCRGWPTLPAPWRPVHARAVGLGCASDSEAAGAASGKLRPWS